MCGKYKNEVGLLHLVTSYCLPRLVCGCESVNLDNQQVRGIKSYYGTTQFGIFLDVVDVRM